MISFRYLNLKIISIRKLRDIIFFFKKLLSSSQKLISRLFSMPFIAFSAEWFVGVQVPYNFIIIDSKLIINAKILNSICDRRGRVRGGAEVPRHRVRLLRGHKEIQGLRRIVAYQEDDHARSENPEDDQPPPRGRAQGGIPQKRHSLPGLRVFGEQPPGSPIETAQWTQNATHPQTHLPAAQRTRLPTRPKHRPPRHKARKFTSRQRPPTQDLRLRLRTTVQGRKRRKRHRLRCHEMVPAARAAGGRGLRQGNRHVGSRMHHVRTHRWKSAISRRK